MPPTPPLTLINHGLKTLGVAKRSDLAIVPRADLYLDCRGIQEHGLNRNNFALYQEQIQKHCPVTIQAMVDTVTDSLRHVQARRMGAANALTKPYVICFLCAWGINRSYTTKFVVGEKLRQLGYEVEIPKRELVD